MTSRGGATSSIAARHGPPPLHYLALLLLVALWLRFFVSLPSTYVVQLNDFPAYYGAGQLAAAHQLDRLYTAEFKWFTNIPLVAQLFRPLGALDYPDAWRLFWWMQVVSYVASFGILVWAIRRYFPPLDLPRALLAGIIFLSFAPILRRCLALGQTTPMMVLLFALIYVSIREGHRRSAGLLLGVLCLIKIPPMLLIPLLLLRRRFDVGLTALAVVVAGFAASWLVFGPELMQHYANRVIWENFGRSEAAFNNQSLDGAFMRLFTDRGLADWTTVPRPGAVTAGVVICALAIAALLWSRAPSFLVPRERPGDDDPERGSLELEIALGIALMVLLFPVVWIHYYLFLAVPMTLLPFWWHARRLPGPAWVVALLVAGIFLASGFESHSNSFYSARETELAFRLLQNLQPLGALCLVAGLSWPLAQIGSRSAD